METFAFPKNSHSSEKRHVAKNLDAVRWRRSRCCPVAIAFLTDNSVEDRRWLDPRRTSGCIARPRDTEDCQWLVQSSMFSTFGFRNRWICTLLDIRRKDVSLDDEIRKNPNANVRGGGCRDEFSARLTLGSLEKGYVAGRRGRISMAVPRQVATWLF